MEPQTFVFIIITDLYNLIAVEVWLEPVFESWWMQSWKCRECCMSC